MNLFELEETESNPIYQILATANTARHYDFMNSMVTVSIQSDKRWLSQPLIQAINFHAIVGLHHEAGVYRSHEVVVGNYSPPAHYRVEPLMDDFVNGVNRNWESHESASLAAQALWALNYIHPFVNGNGRTARAVCYFILCVKSGGLLPGRTILPDILRREPIRSEYIKGLQNADKGDLSALTTLIRLLIRWQIVSSTR